MWDKIAFAEVSGLAFFELPVILSRSQKERPVRLSEKIAFTGVSRITFFEIAGTSLALERVEMIKIRRGS